MADTAHFWNHLIRSNRVRKITHAHSSFKVFWAPFSAEAFYYFLAGSWRSWGQTILIIQRLFHSLSKSFIKESNLCEAHSFCLFSVGWWGDGGKHQGLSLRSGSTWNHFSRCSFLEDPCQLQTSKIIKISWIQRRRFCKRKTAISGTFWSLRFKLLRFCKSLKLRQFEMQIHKILVLSSSTLLKWCDPKLCLLNF